MPSLPTYKHNEVNCISDGPANVEAAVKEAITVHKSLVTLMPTNHLKLVKVHTAAHKVNSAKLKGWYLSPLSSKHLCNILPAVYLISFLIERFTE
jgi:hypothetical protein